MNTGTNFFFTKSKKNRRNKLKQNDLSQKFSNWRRFFEKIAKISLFTEISKKFLRFLAKFLDISIVDILPSSFVSPPTETRNFDEKNRNFHPCLIVPVNLIISISVITDKSLPHVERLKLSYLQVILYRYSIQSMETARGRKVLCLSQALENSKMLCPNVFVSSDS